MQTFTNKKFLQISPFAQGLLLTGVIASTSLTYPFLPLRSLFLIPNRDIYWPLGKKYKLLTKFYSIPVQPYASQVVSFVDNNYENFQRV